MCVFVCVFVFFGLAEEKTSIDVIQPLQRDRLPDGFMIRKSKCGFILDEFGCSKYSDYPLQNTARWILWTWNFREFCWVL